MLILSLNCGSSSIKSALIDSSDGRRLLDARVENIGAADTVLQVGEKRRRVQEGDQAAALQLLVNEIRSARADVGMIEAVAHRIVHGGERFTRATIVDEEVLKHLAQLDHLAPLHNPPALAALRRARTALSGVPHVAVFDTAFHSTLPPHAREYALPADIRRQYGVRRYGFHGISHEHVMRSVATQLRIEPHLLRIISCHLGAGASVTAIQHGRSVETSMGMTPLEGVVMGTRGGDIDAGVLLHLLHAGIDAERLDDILNRRSGLIGLTGTSDMRAIQRRAEDGDESCTRAIALYSHRLRKYIGAYAGLMGGVDAISFTAGVGENSSQIRRLSTQGLEFLGVVLDEDHNRDVKVTAGAPFADISRNGSRARVVVVRADEEQSMARQAAGLLGRAPAKPGRGAPPPY